MRVDQFGGLVGSQSEALADDGRMNILLHEVLATLEEFSSDDDSAGGAVVAVLLLGLGDLDDHLSSGVLDVHLLEDGSTVVGDYNISHAVDQHLVHSLGP